MKGRSDGDLDFREDDLYNMGFRKIELWPHTTISRAVSGSAIEFDTLCNVMIGRLFLVFFGFFFSRSPVARLSRVAATEEERVFERHVPFSFIAFSKPLTSRHSSSCTSKRNEEWESFVWDDHIPSTSCYPGKV